jgi:PAS domain S-box-containing protein
MGQQRAKTQEQSLGETAVVSLHGAEGRGDHAALLEALASDAPFGLCFLALPDFRCEYANAALAEITGATVEAMLGRTRAEIIGAEAAQEPDALCRQALESGRPVTGAEMRLRLAGSPGENRHFQISYLPVYEANGQPRGVWSVVQETTQRHRQEGEVLRARQEAEQAGARLRALFDAMEAPVLMADVNGRLIETNAAGRRYLNGGSAREALPTLAEYLASHPMLNAEGLPIPDAMRPIVRALAGEIVHGLEVQILLPEGRPMWALANAVPVRSADGRILGGVLTLQDVTHRHEAREQLEQAYQEADTERQLLTHIFDNIPFTHVALFNQEGQLVRINPDGPRLLGYETAEPFRAALAQPEAWKVLRTDGTPVPPDEWPLARALRGERFDSEEYHVLTPDGYEACFLMNGGPVAWDREGSATLAVNVGHDVRELRRLMDAEREKAQRLVEAFAETHHRVKNNLQVIAALLDMRVMDDGEDAPPVTRDDLRRMVGQVRAIAAVHDFLSHHQSAMTVSARELVKRLVPMAMQTAGVKATWQADEVVVSVQQGTALALILQELLSNAGKHGAQAARVSLQYGGAGCLLEVADDGPGFPPGFDAGREAHQGLALVVTLAERDLQGHILFETGDSGGGSVRIRFQAVAG